MNFERLFFIREMNEFTQDDIGKILNVSRVAVSNWENSKEIIPLQKLNLFSNYFNVSMDYLVKLSDEKTKIKNNLLNKKRVGENLKSLREELNITQNQLAHLLNTSHSTISAYESGKTMILTAFAYEICKEYNVSLDWLCGKTDDKYIKERSTV